MKVHFDNGKGVQICGIISPNAGKSTLIAILCHGLNSDKDSATNLALEKILSEKGIATFRFDFFAHGESRADVNDRTLEEFVNDISRAVNFLKARGHRKFGIYANSFGAVAAVIAASRISDFKVMALKAPGMGQTSRNMQNYKHDFDTKKWITAGASITVPTLIIHGTADKDVEIQLGQELAKAIRSSKLEIFKDADHRFSNPEDFKKCVAHIAEFIAVHIGS